MGSKKLIFKTNFEYCSHVEGLEKKDILNVKIYRFIDK